MSLMIFDTYVPINSHLNTPLREFLGIEEGPSLLPSLLFSSSPPSRDYHVD